MFNSCSFYIDITITKHFHVLRNYIHIIYLFIYVKIIVLQSTSNTNPLLYFPPLLKSSVLPGWIILCPLQLSVLHFQDELLLQQMSYRALHVLISMKACQTNFLYIDIIFTTGIHFLTQPSLGCSRLVIIRDTQTQIQREVWMRTKMSV